MTFDALQLQALLCVLLAVGALAGAAAALKGRPARDPQRAPERWRRKVVALQQDLPPKWRDRWRWLLLAAAGVGAVMWVVTGWPMQALLSAAAVFALPFVIYPDGHHKERIARLEAMSSWLYQMAGLHAVGVALPDMIKASVKSAPAPIAPEVTALAARLRSGRDPQVAFAYFADDMADGVADHIVLTFQSHTENKGRGLSHALEQLAASIAEMAEEARDTDAERNRTRTAARAIIVIFMAAVVAVLLSEWSRPYATGQGQLALAVLGTLLVFAFLGLRRMGRPQVAPRLLEPGAGDRALAGHGARLASREGATA